MANSTIIKPLIVKAIFTKFQQISALSFSIIWIGVLLLFYLSHHHYYFDSWQYFQYGELLIGLALGSIAAYFFLKFPEKFSVKNHHISTGLGLWVSIILLSILIYLYQFNYGIEGYELSFIGLINFVGRLVWVQANLLMIISLCFCLGDFCYRIFFKEVFADSANIIRIGLGIICLTFLMMILGAFSLLKIIILLPIAIILFLLFHRRWLHFIKIILTKPIKLQKDISLFGAGSFFLLFFWMSCNFISILRPIPFGYDSMTLYMRLPSLINDYAALVPGNQPYNWSIFMSLGYLVFQQTAMVLGLSFVGGALSLIALFVLFSRWLEVNTNAFCLLLFYSLPTINFIGYQDMKIDLGLLFYLLCIVLILLSSIEKAGDSTNPKIKTSAIILLGIFSGFAIGIKLTALFLVFGVLGILSYYFFSFLGLVATLSLTFFSIFLLDFDQFNGLQAAFIGQAYIQWGLLVIGLIIIGSLFLKNKDKAINTLKYSTLYLLFTGMTFLPWPIKNVLETGDFSTQTLIYGQTKSQQLDIIEMEEKWRVKYEVN